MKVNDFLILTQRKALCLNEMNVKEKILHVIISAQTLI